MHTAVPIPVYNELQNLEKLVPILRDLLPGIDIIVVDDSSPDGTADFVKLLQQTDAHLHLIHRSGKMGYASALKEGHRYALQRGAQILCQMDADFSHDPRSLPSLLEAVENDDVVLGSRYIPGGGTRNWGFFRRFLSGQGNAFARSLLAIPANDCTGGFRCFRRQAFERGNLLDIEADGYCFQILVAYECHRAGLSIREVPIMFEDRRIGESKLSKRIIVEALLKVTGRWWRDRVLGKGRPRESGPRDNKES